MAKVTSKLQVTVPKSVADRYGIRPGDDIEWVAAGEMIRVVPARRGRKPLTVSERLRRFDLATARAEKREASPTPQAERSRGWSREELYHRGRAR